MDSPKLFSHIHSSFILTIFGATGDLTHTKLIPGLLALFNEKMFPEEFFIVGFSRREMTDEEFRNSFPEHKEREGWGDFSKHLYYHQGTFEDKQKYEKLNEKLHVFDNKLDQCIAKLFYLATPPLNYEEILDNLHATRLSEGCGHLGHTRTKVVIEKPFGRDLATAKALDEKLSNYLIEEQIFRVDHYLGKETVQNILAFRFANGIFEPIWNKDYIDHVQITWAEEKGVEGRGQFFEQVGILRDVIQNHMFQLVAAVAMEQPVSFTKESIRDTRAAAIKAIKRLDQEKIDDLVVRGQHEGFRVEKDVSYDSQTETFVALKLFVETPRFQEVPFYLRAGKAMEKDCIEISVVFRQTCHILFKEYGCPEIGNVITIRIQPDAGIALRIIGKKPGPKLSLGDIDMKFSYKETFGTYGIDAYEKILLDIFSGDQMLFNRSDELESSWELVTEILKGWEGKNPNFPNYEKGGWGPKGANELIEKDGRKWLLGGD
jgi:glucose-6-phosphate 1-dehydrogenase